MIQLDTSEKWQSPLAQQWQENLLQPNGEALEAASCCSEVIKIQYPVYVKNDKIISQNEAPYGKSRDTFC